MEKMLLSLFAILEHSHNLNTADRRKDFHSMRAKYDEDYAGEPRREANSIAKCSKTEKMLCKMQWKGELCHRQKRH